VQVHPGMCSQTVDLSGALMSHSTILWPRVGAGSVVLVLPETRGSSRSIKDSSSGGTAQKENEINIDQQVSGNGLYVTETQARAEGVHDSTK